MAEQIPDAWKEFDPDVEYDKNKLDQRTPEQKKRETEMVKKFWLRFMNAEVAVKPLHEEVREIDKFDRGEQWKGQAIPPWVPKPVKNYIRYTRKQKRANLVSVVARPQFTPLSVDDVEIVSKLQLAHDHVWDTHRVDRHIRRAYDRAHNQGTAIMYVYHDDSFFGGKYFPVEDPQDPNRDVDYSKASKKGKKSQLFQGDIKFRRWPIENFFPDPDAYNLDEAKWIDTTEIVPLRNVKNNPAFIKYCKENGTIGKLMTLDYTELEYVDDASGTILERDYTPLETPRNIPGDEIVTLHTHWERYYKNGQWHLDVTYWLYNTDFFLLRLEDEKPAKYPFALLYDEEEENTIWGTSTSKDILELQKLINKADQVKAIIGALNQNPQKVVSRESGINAQEVARTGTLPGKVWTSNIPAKDAISILTPPDIPPGLQALTQDTEAAIQNLTGMNDTYTGKNVGSLTTSTGVDSLMQQATAVDRDKMIQIDAFVEQISNLIVAYILYKWKDKRPLMAMTNTGVPQFGEWDPDAVKEIGPENISWRVRSDIYQKAPQTQQQRQQQADKQMQWQGQYQFNPPLITPEEWVRRQEFQDQQEILTRMQKDRIQMQQDQANDLAQQIAQIASQLQQAGKQGASQQAIAQMSQQLAQQIVQQRQQEQFKNGINQQPAGQSAPSTGVANQSAMSAMNSGQAG